MEDIKLTHIEAPKLESSDYGKNIEEQFNNIDNNFKLISNKDFVKGDSGNSLYIENVKITKDGKGIEGELYKALKTAIEKTFDSDSKGTLNSVGDYSWDDAITQVSETDEEVGEGEDKKSGIYAPIIVSENKTTGEVEYICAASPVMLFDNRFNKDAIETVDSSYYEDRVDVTSILNFKKDGDDNWVCELNLSYPRLQYKDGSFCWVINNENTIVKSTGIKGDQGESANIWIAQIPNIPEEYDGAAINIAKYFVNGEWAVNAPENIKDGDLAIVYCEDDDKEYYGFFVSQIKIDETNNTVVYNPKANIQNINYLKNTTEFFKSLGNSNAARGMFLKFYSDSPSSKEAHIFYNNDENLFIKPVGNYEYTGVEDYAGSEQPSINIEAYSETNINSKKININSGHCNISSKEGMELKDDNSILIESNNVAISGETSLSDKLTISKGGLDVTGNTIINGNTEIRGEVGPSSDEITTDVPGGKGLVIYGGKGGDSEEYTGRQGGIGLDVYGGEGGMGSNVPGGTGLAIHAHGNIRVDGSVTSSNGFFDTSDERLKNFTRDVDVNLDIIRNIPKKYFTWKTDHDSINNIGTSAQEVMKLYPELVSKGNDGVLSVAYDKLSIIALKAIDILNEKNKELEERIKKLEDIVFK